MRGLFATHASIVDPEVRRQSRLLAICLSVLTPLFMCVDTALSLTTPTHSPPWLGCVFLISTFVLNRAGKYGIASAMAMAMFPIVAFAQIYLRSTTFPLLTLGYLPLGPILGSIFLPIGGVVALSIVNLIVIALAAQYVPEVRSLGALLVGPVSMNAMVGLLASSYMHHRNGVEADRRTVLLAEIAERQALEDRLLQGQKMEALGKFAGGIAHDFNNVLMVILGNVTLASRRAPSPELRQIESSVSSAAALTRQLLAFGRRAVIEPTVLDLGVVVSEAVEMIRRIIGEAITIEKELPRATLLAKLDRAQIEQVLLNLATNARDAMPDGGTLRITASEEQLTRDNSEIPLDASEGTYICLSVSDDGMGMAEDTRQRVFEPFFTTKPRGRGTGLGLASVLGIVSQSAGFIRVSSQPGRGTRFDLYFPRSTQALAPVDELVSAAPTSGIERVLVVEDDDGVRFVVTMILSEAGYEVVQARSLREARAVWADRGRTIAMVITDMVMSDGYGLDFVLELRKHSQGVPVLCMSGYAERDGRDGGMQGLPHLQKPFNSEDLLSKVRGLIDKARAEQAAPAISA